jgi:hypothetical protein
MIVGTGTCTVTFDQAGTANYNPAPQVLETVSATTVPLTITASSPTMGYGTAVPPIVPLYTGLVHGDSAPATPPSCGTAATTTSPAGSYATSCSSASDANYTISYASGTLTINRVASTAAVNSSLNPSIYGQPITFTATVARSGGGYGTPTGSVTFKDGSTTLGMGTLAVVNGATVATLLIPASNPLAVAGHSISAVYGGDGNFTGSTSSSLPQTVNQASTTTTLTAQPNPSLLNGAVTFTAAVAPVTPGTGVPSGTVTFKDGTTTLVTGSLTSSGLATFTTSSLVIGSHTIAASYGGSASYKSSASSPVTQAVRYTVHVLGTSMLTIVLQLWDANNSNVGSSTIAVTAECVVGFTTTAPTSCGASPVQTISGGTFGFNSHWQTFGPTYQYSLSPRGLTRGQAYYLLVKTDGDPTWHAVMFTY